MGHSKEHMVDVMNINVAEMKEVLAFAKVKDTHLILHVRATELHVDLLREGFAWLREVYETKFLPYVKVRELLSKEQWDRYLLWEDYEDFAEVILLRKATFEFRKTVVSRHRPDLFKKGKTNGAIKAIDRAKKADEKAKAKAKKAKLKEGATN